MLRRQIRHALYRPRFLPPVTKLVLGRYGTIRLRREDLGPEMAWRRLSAPPPPIDELARLEVVAVPRSLPPEPCLVSQQSSSRG